MTIEGARNAAAAAWGRYASSVQLGGTDPERVSALRQAVDAERRLAALEGTVWPMTVTA